MRRVGRRKRRRGEEKSERRMVENVEAVSDQASREEEGGQQKLPTSMKAKGFQSTTFLE